MWERWDGWTEEKGFQNFSMNSFNHFAFGSVGRWLYQYMAGIDTDDVEVGFKKIVIKPRIGLGINSTEAWYWTRRGFVSVEWEKTKDTFKLLVNQMPSKRHFN